MTHIAVNGIHLNAEVSGFGPDVVLIHGFTGDTSTWDGVMPAFEGFRTVRIDLIGHGASDSPDDPERYTMAHAVEDITAVLDALGIEKAALLGYSLGGRVALHIATQAPERWWALILESAAPGIEDVAERAARVVADNALADGLLRDGLEAFIDRWQSQALFVSQLQMPPDAQEKQRRSRLAQSPLGLANSLRGMGAGRQDYLLPLLSAISVPTLVLAGDLDTKYTALTNQMSLLIPESAALIEAGAGHSVHLEHPEAFIRAVSTFLTFLLGDDGSPTHRAMIPNPVF